MDRRTALGSLILAAALASAAPAHACDTSGRLDAFHLAERADSVFVGHYRGGGAFTPTATLRGTAVAATQLREGSSVECAAPVRPGAQFLVLVSADGAPVGAYRSAIEVAGPDDPLVGAVRAWLASRSARSRRRLLLDLLANGEPAAAREAAFGLAQAGWWRPLHARTIAGERCPAVLASLRGFNVEWNRTGLRERVLRDLIRACDPRH